MKRFRRLLYPKSTNGARTPLLSAVVLIAAAAVTLAAWQPEPPPQSFSPYQMWLNQEVVYIISSAERAAFEKLTTDADRDKFIEQFWLLRDPTPGTDENEFREEHYRRIAFSNDRFKPAIAKGGWQTDRGRIYIQYGPPDEIERHREGGPQQPYPSEVWRYRHIDGIGNDVIVTFIDPTRTGEFRQTKENEKIQ